MADKSTELILDALTRAVADPHGQPLFASKSIPGLFAATGSAKTAAQRCKDEDFLRVVRTETRGKNSLEICTLTEKGLTYLLGQSSPRQVLEDLVRAVEARQEQFTRLAASVDQARASLDALKTTTAKVLEQVLQTAKPRVSPNELWEKFQSNGGRQPSVGMPDTGGSRPPLAETILSLLDQWQPTATTGDYPLPDLYRRACPSQQFSIGQFHDALRRLHDAGQVYLHPWAGPLYDMPEPSVALLVGHEIAYYASRK